MTNGYFQLRRIAYAGPDKTSDVAFVSGVNVICGASDTGKSLLAESVDFMLGGSDLREVPERRPYADIYLDVAIGADENWRFRRATSGGNFAAKNLNDAEAEEEVLRQQHAHDRTDNMSGFLLDKIGLRAKRILRSKRNAKTQSLSFRNLARLIIVQEGEIQQRGSPFWGGQYTLKTAELATIKLLLTGIDDSNVVTSGRTEGDQTKQIELVDELISDIEVELTDSGKERAELEEQLGRLDTSIEARRESLDAAQRQLDTLLEQRREVVEYRTSVRNRLDEISDLLTRFDLLQEHYSVDLERLTAIQESGSMFAHVEAVPCPLCGAPPDAQQHEDACDGDVEVIVQAATAEIEKVERLRKELHKTVEDLKAEARTHEDSLKGNNAEYQQLNLQIQETVSPNVGEERSSFSELIETRSSVQRTVDLFVRADKLKERRLAMEQDSDEGGGSGEIVVGIPDVVAHEFSQKLSSLLKAWDFPGDCHVHFDKETTDFVIDGKPRGSRGKGLRAITHAAVTISLLEYCQEHELPHPGFVVLDSPLLAYFKPEGDDDALLQGTNLKERFYQYLVTHHSSESQIVIVENQHPPDTFLDRLNMTVFTGNPNEGRAGFL